MVNIICGPVVGLVTPSSARILIELDEATTINVVLRSEEDDITKTETLQAEANVPSVLQFDGLKEAHNYGIYLPDVTENKLGNVHTLPMDVTSLKMVFLSCDNPITYTSPMWDKLYELGTAQGIHMIMHVGDNVYADEAVFTNLSVNINDIIGNDDILDSDQVNQNSTYLKARRILKGLPREEWPSKRDELLNVYRQKYREIWGRPDKARVLANFSNIMLLDDHEIRDDIGVHEDDSNPDSKEFFLGHIALHVYHEYQRQLWDGNIFTIQDSLLSEFFKLDIGPVRLVFTDQRMSSSLYKARRQPEDDSCFGKEQMDEILACLQPPEDAKPRLLIIVNGMPFVYLKKSTINLISYVVDDMDALIVNRQEDELLKVLDAIWNWKQKMGPSSDCLMIVGDIHIGGFTDIIKEVNGENMLLCRQITSSAIQNKPLGSLKLKGLRAVMSFTENYKSYTYKHYDFVDTCNFAVISTEITDAVKYTVSLVSEKAVAIKESSQTDWDNAVTTPCGCNIN